jgi:hypothetical protein
MKIDGIQKRPVHVEDGGFRHSTSSGRDRLIFAYQTA